MTEQIESAHDMNNLEMCFNKNTLHMCQELHVHKECDSPAYQRTTFEFNMCLPVVTLE